MVWSCNLTRWEYHDEESPASKSEGEMIKGAVVNILAKVHTTF